MWQKLGYLGLLPFIGALYLSLVPSLLDYSAQKFFIYYSAIILSFLAGTIWNSGSNSAQQKCQISSNLFSLSAFLCLLIPYQIALFILSLCYIVLFSIERIYVTGILENCPYIVMRKRLTTIVVSLHLVAYIVWPI
jgi:hypothetical protein